MKDKTKVFRRKDSKDADKISFNSVQSKESNKKSLFIFLHSFQVTSYTSKIISSNRYLLKKFAIIFFNLLHNFQTNLPAFGNVVFVRQTR